MTLLAGALIASGASALTSAIVLLKEKKLERGIGRIIRELNKRDEETMEMIIEAITAKETLSQKTILAITVSFWEFVPSSTWTDARIFARPQRLRTLLYSSLRVRSNPL
jgi:hypothetical protein